MFLETPRWFGFPTQYYIRSEEGLAKVFETMNGKKPCFVSVLTYPEPTKHIFDKIFFDLDTKGSLVEPYDDVVKLIEYCDKIHFPYTIVFSGRKGFHFYIHTRPSDVTSVKLYAVHEQLAKQLELKTLDKKVYGDTRRIARIPTSVYIDRKGKKNKNYCRYLTVDDFNKGLKHIRKLAKSPGILPEKPIATKTFDEFTANIKGYLEATYFENGNGRVDLTIDQTQEEISTLYVITAECLRRHISDENPIHIIRYETSCMLKLLGYNNVAIYNFFSQFSWKDWRRDMTRYQVRRAKSRPPKCYKLKHFIGDKYCENCPLSKEVENERL